jgi:hypothetical protein
MNPPFSIPEAYFATVTIYATPDEGKLEPGSLLIMVVLASGSRAVADDRRDRARGRARASGRFLLEYIQITSQVRLT